MTYTTYRDLFAVSENISITKYTDFHGITNYGIDCKMTEFEMTDFRETYQQLNKEVKTYPIGEPDEEVYKRLLIREILNDPYDKIYLNWFITIIDKELINPFLLNYFISFHYQQTPYKDDFLEMIECDVLPFLKNIPSKKRVEAWLSDEKKRNNKKVKKDNTPSVVKPSARHWALCFAYLYPNASDIKPLIYKFHQLQNANVSAERIRQMYYNGEFGNSKMRVTIENLKDIEFVIKHLLKDYPTETKQAKEEVNQIKNML